MNAVVYLEGGGDSKELHARCREGFRKLLEACGFSGRMPRLIACGGRGMVFDDFSSAHAYGNADFVAMWIDSEEVLTNLEQTWSHLESRDRWVRPPGAEDQQVLLMTTCMETWLVADREALKKYYGNEIQENALPPLTSLETRHRHDVQEKLSHATRNCSNAFAKGKRSFQVLGKLTPAVLEQHLPSFVRVRRILDQHLVG